jgi:DNA-binding winged helix-turn-helix (wHTH) protein
MAQETAGTGTAGDEFDLGGWRVRPSLNRLARDGSTVRLEPKMMDVLTTLASHAGRVVSKDDLAAAVWPDVFVTESVITRAIAGLRRALEDDARDPRFIETIAKRGYRLIAEPRPLAGHAPPAAPAGAPAAPSAGSAQSPPYAAGQWVRGERFHGREAEIAEVLDGPRNALWLLGSRAIGKTSTLRQLEHLCAGGGYRGYLPLFWDLQGSDAPERLDADFAEALADAGERLAGAGVNLDEVGADDFLVSLGRLRRALAGRGLTLLLLLDEAEELLGLQERSPALLRKLRRALLSPEGIRTVLASSGRLWRLADRDDDTSPFLHGFAPPVYLGCLDEAAARRLVLQGSGEPHAAPDDQAVEEIVRLSGGHPFLLQLLGTRYWQLGDLGRAADTVAADASVHRLFAVDFELLSAPERELLRELAGTGGAREEDLGAPAPDPGDAAALLHLERLGVVRRSTDGRIEIRSPLLRRWLECHPKALDERRPSAAP